MNIWLSHSIKSIFGLFAIFLFGQSLLFGGFWGFDGTRLSYEGDVWKRKLPDFTEASYAHAVESMITDFESVTGKKLIPGVHGKVALKIYTNSFQGLGTPQNLVRAVIDSLMARGYKRHNIILVDYREDLLRENGFLPALSQRDPVDNFEGSPVCILGKDVYWDKEWFHDDPLPVPLSQTYAHMSQTSANMQDVDLDEQRKSYLPVVLFNEVDFFINLPMYSDDQAMGINGALANPTLWAVSNHERFMRSTKNAPPAIAEIGAIPELMSNWAFTIATLERYQYIGGPVFNSLYSASEPVLYLSSNPVILDQLVLDKLNKRRLKDGFKELSNPLPVLIYATQLGLGMHSPSRIHWHEETSSNE